MTLRAMCTWIAAAALGLGVAACGDDSEDEGDGGAERDSGRANPPGGDRIEIAGTWSTPFGDVTIDDRSWKDAFFEVAVVSFDNSDNFAITQNADDIDAGAGLYGKNVWTEPNDDGFFFCTVDFNLDTAQDAEDSRMTADDSDPANGGCGGPDFAWTEATPK